MTCEGSLLGASEFYRKLGLSIVPVAWKQPFVRWGRGKIDPELMDSYISDPRTTGIAVILGRPSGNLIARDFDRVDSYEAWAYEHRDLAASLPTARTARGYHVYGIAPGVRTRKFDDGELRGAGSVMVLPPSLTRGSDPYRWLIPVRGRIPIVDPALFGGSSETPSKPQRNAVTKYLQLHVFGTGVGDPEIWIAESIRKTIPTRHGERHHKLWDLARRIRRLHPKNTSFEILYPIVVSWYGVAVSRMGTKDFDETWRDFKIAWGNVQVPFSDAFKRVVQDGVDETWTCGMGKNVDAVGRLMQSADLVVGSPFFMSNRYIACAIGISQQPVYEATQRLIESGIVEIVEKGARGTHRGKATMWRWIGIHSSALGDKGALRIARPTTPAILTAS